MATISCNKCNGQVSEDAQACPHCGHRDQLFNIRRQRNERNYKENCSKCGRLITPEVYRAFKRDGDWMDGTCDPCVEDRIRRLKRIGSG